MYYVVQEKLFREENYENLINTLERLDLDYEIYHLDKFDQELNVKTDHKNIFPFGAVKMAKIAKKYDWKPGSFYNGANYDFRLLKEFYGEHLLNHDAEITSIVNKITHSAPFFAKPILDSKAFTGQLFNTVEEWYNFIKARMNVPGSIITPYTQVQIASPKTIYKEIRFWIVKGEIVTASVYNMWNNYFLSEYVDADAYEFVEDMIKIYQPAEAFVMDICLTEDEYKIVEINCINSAGFYKADMNKLIMALEDAFN